MQINHHRQPQGGGACHAPLRTYQLTCVRAHGVRPYVHGVRPCWVGGEVIPFRIGLLMVTIIFLFGSPPAQALREAPSEESGGGGGSENAFKQIVHEREEARDRAGQRLQELSTSVRESSVTVKIRGRVSDENPRGIVISEEQVNPEDLDEDNPSAIYRRVKKSALTKAGDPASVGESSEASRGEGHRPIAEQKLTRAEKGRNWLFLGALVLAAGGWWVKQRSPL